MGITFRITKFPGARSIMCAAAALVVAGWASPALAGGPVNDECTTPVVISGDGLFSFDNTLATTGVEGQDSQACAIGGLPPGIDKDLWYVWTATCTGLVTIETCGLTNVNTKIALYDGAGCPVLNIEPLCCDDDSCAEQSSIRCDVVWCVASST